MMTPELTSRIGVASVQGFLKCETDDYDPDADFRPMLQGVIDTRTGYDGNKIEETLEG